MMMMTKDQEEGNQEEVPSISSTPPPLPPRSRPTSIQSNTPIKTQSSHSHSHSRSISQWAINHLLPTSLFNHHSSSKSTSNSTWPPDEWFEPYSPKTNQSPSSSTTTTSTPSTSYPNDLNTHTNTIIPRRLPPRQFNLPDKPMTNRSLSPLSNTTSSISNLKINSDPQDTISLEPSESETDQPNSSTHTIMMESPTNTISFAPVIPSRTNPIITDSPINTISLAPPLNLSQSDTNDEPPFDQNFVMESPTNTLSLAPIQSEESGSNKSLSSNCSPLMESPANTNSLAPTLPSEPSHDGNRSTNHQPVIMNQTPPVTPSIPNLINPTPLPSSPSNPPTLASPSTPTFINQSSRPVHAFHPPPLHPDLRPSKTVKETLDAHLYRSHDGYRQVNQYILKHDLGRGSFGAVRLAVDAQTGLEYAVKEFSKKRLRRKFGNVLCVGDNGGDEDALHLIRNEVAIMKKVQHPNIVKLYEVLDVEGEDSLYMVMEYCRGGRLESGIQDHGLIRRYFRQLMIGIDYLHQNEIIHHDIKPDNILLSSDRKQIKIVDFGISALFESSQQQRLMGSPAFLSPEIITGQSSGGTESDIWAMGVTLYCMIEGKLPFGEKGEALDLYHDIQEVAPDIPETWDPRLIDLIAKMLDKDPTSRIKLPEMSQHPWITDTGKLSNVTLIENQQEGIYKINKNHSEFELRECLKIGFTDQCEKFKEIVESSLRIGRGKRKEFFKEFYRLLGEKSVLGIEKYHTSK